MLGGEIRVNSELGVGSTFTMILPARPPEKQAQEDRVSGGEQFIDPAVIRFGKNRDKDARRKKVSKILVIDDDPDIHELMKRNLTREGFYVSTADNAADGIHLAKSNKPDLITLDVMMSETDGYQALVELKETDGLKDIPVIILTMVSNKELSMSLGAAEHITKPLNWETLLPTIVKHIRRKLPPDLDAAPSGQN
jgi:CheY-like chemotaxis protein